MNIFGLLLDIIGGILIFFESLKMGVRYDENRNPIPGVNARPANFFMRHIGRIGLALLILGFIFQLFSNLADIEMKNHKAASKHKQSDNNSPCQINKDKSSPFPNCKLDQT